MTSDDHEPHQPNRQDTVLRHRAATQLGLLRRDQTDPMAARTLHRRGSGVEWECQGPRLLRHVAAPRTDRQQALAAVLDAGDGAFLSHASAAAHWGLPGFRLRPAHVVTVRTSHPVHRPVGRVHRMRALQPHHGTVLEGIPVVRPELLMLQLCAVVSPARAERLVDRAWSMRLLSGRSIRRVLDEVAGSGVLGSAVTLRREEPAPKTGGGGGGGGGAATVRRR